MKKGITLVGDNLDPVDARAMGAPSDEEKHAIRVNDLVELRVTGFVTPGELLPTSAEAFYVRVTDKNAQEFRGAIESKLAFSEHHELQKGDQLAFGPQHIFSVVQLDNPRPIAATAGEIIAHLERLRPTPRKELEQKNIADLEEELFHTSHLGKNVRVMFVRSKDTLTALVHVRVAPDKPSAAERAIARIYSSAFDTAAGSLNFFHALKEAAEGELPDCVFGFSVPLDGSVAKTIETLYQSLAAIHQEASRLLEIARHLPAPNEMNLRRALAQSGHVVDGAGSRSNEAQKEEE
jgi:hypothetical protein